MLLPGQLSLAGRVLKKFFGRGPKTNVLLVRNFMEQEPNPENRITLSEGLDILGCSKPKIHWQISERDKQTMITFHELLRDEVAEQNLGSFESPLLSANLLAWPISQDASHHMGATRMGLDPSTSVVDRNCQVHSVANLHIAGSSVFPSSGFANPTATLVALAIRLADHLKSKSI